MTHILWRRAQPD